MKIKYLTKLNAVILKCKLVFTFTVAVFSLSAHAAPHSMAHHAMMDVNWTHEAVRDGNWNERATWNNRRVPGNNANVRIPEGVSVNLARQNTTNLDRVLVQGTLSFMANANTRLIVDSLNVDAGGRLQIGTSANPVQQNRTAEIVFRDSAGVPFDSGRSNLGMMVSGDFLIYGAEKTARKTLRRDLTAGSRSVAVNGGAGNWNSGDEILLTSTQYRRGAALQNEIRRITGTRANGTLDLNDAVNYSHIRGNNGRADVYVANLTRNVIFRSATPNNINSRGHIMFMPGANVDVNFASFIGLGRTDKSKPTSGTNPQGRYAFHFHRNGLDKVQKVNGIVVHGTPGWGIVNHSSHVDVRNSIVHDFAGSAFVTEAGDELGSFVGNLASGGTLAPDHPKYHSRHAFGRMMPRFRTGDLGFSAIGFWLAGPKVDLIDNVVAGSRGTAYFYFSLGNYEAGNGYQMTGLPMDRVERGFKLARWRHRNQFSVDGERNVEMAVSSYLGTGVFRDNEAYGVFQGLRTRWTGHHSRQILKRMPAEGTGRINGEVRIRRNPTLYGASEFVNSLFWNVDEGMSITYSSRITVRNATVFNDRASGQKAGTMAVRARTGNTETPIKLQNVSLSDFNSDIERACSMIMDNVQLSRMGNTRRCGK